MTFALTSEVSSTLDRKSVENINISGNLTFMQEKGRYSDLQSVKKRKGAAGDEMTTGRGRSTA